ncbi:MAG TPA: FUSC family protein [Bryobacteraceae bacterium]|nr:FUSC family protein [Bryobacteraceae bacterium]
MPHRVPLQTLWRTLIRFESQKIVPQIAIRNAIGFSLAVILGTLAVSPSTGAVAALGALNVSFSDGLDPYRFRARRMLLSSLFTGVAVVAGALSAHNNTAAVIVAAAWAFAAGMLVALGTTAADLGVVTVVTVVVFAAKALPWTQALQAGFVAMCGGLVQTLLSTFLWPLRRYEPERRILAQIYETLADVTQAPPEGRNAPPMTTQISDAQDALAPLARDHSVEAERHVFLLAQAERIRLSILNAGRLQRRIARHEGGAEAAAALQKILGCASGAIRLVGERISNGDGAANTDKAMANLTGCLVEFDALRTTPGGSFFAALLRDARQQSVALRSQIRAAASAAAAKDDYPGPAAAGERPADSPPNWRLRFQGYRARLLANLSLDSTVFRHAVRMAVCLAIGDIIGRAIVLQRTYWIPMTIAIVLKPDFTSTFARGVLRIGGTIVGLVFATLLFHVIHGGVFTDIALMAAFTLLLRWAGPANYGVFVFAVSGLVVLLIAVTGVAPADVIAARAMNTMLGGMLALTAYAVWPTWEKTQTRAALVEMLEAYREYTHAVLGAWLGASRAAINDTRLKGRRARSNAQASVERMAGEPGITERQIVALNTVLVHSHSFVHAVMAMESHLYRARREATPAWMAGFAASVETALDALIARVSSTPPGAKRLKIDVQIPAPGTGGNEIAEVEADRIRVSLRSLAEEISRGDWI